MNSIVSTYVFSCAKGPAPRLVVETVHIVLAAFADPGIGLWRSAAITTMWIIVVVAVVILKHFRGG